MKQTVEQWKAALKERIPELAREVSRLERQIDLSYTDDTPVEQILELKDKQRSVAKELDQAMLDVLPTDKKYVSQYLYTDVKAFEVLEELTPNKIVVRELEAKMTNESQEKLHDSFIPGGFCGHFDNDLQEWEFTSREANPEITLRRHKDGNYYEAGTRSCPYVVKDRPYKFYDFNF